MRTDMKRGMRFLSPGTWPVILAVMLAMVMMPHAALETEAATWGSPYVITTITGQTSMSMDVDGDWIYCVYVQSIRGIPTAMMRYYNGTAWSAQTTVSDRLSTSATFPVVSVSNGVAHIAYVDTTDGDRDILYRTFNGTTLSPIQQVSDPRAGAEDAYPDVAADGNYVHIVWESVIANDRDICFRSAYAGRFGSIQTVSTDVDDDVQLDPAVAASGANAHVVWKDYKGGNRNIFYRHWDGAAWDNERDLNGGNDGVQQLNADVAVDGDNVYIVYQNQISAMSSTISSVMYVGGRWGNPADVPAGSGSLAYPLLDAEAGHLALVYSNTQTFTSTHFLHFDRHSWGTPETVERGTTDQYVNPTSVALQHGRVHVTVENHGQGDQVHRYYAGEVDEEEPSAEVGVITPVWIDLDRISIPYTASDDYGLDSVTFQYRYSTDNATWGRWTEVTTFKDIWDETSSGTFSFQAEDGEGFYEFKAYARDLVGKVEAPSIEPEARAVLDLTDPTGSISINGGDEYANSSSVTLYVTQDDATSGVAGIRFAEEAIGGDEPWEDPVDTKRWTFPAVEGEHTVAYQVMDLSGRLSPVYTDTIYLDLADPYGTITMTVQGNWTTTRDLTLELTYGDTGSGVSMVRFAEEAIGGDEPWENPLDTRQWKLSEGDGAHTIAYQVLDAAGRTSEVYTVSIGLDTTPPTGSLIMGGSDTILTDSTVVLDLTAEDETSGVAGIRVGNDEFIGDDPWDNEVDELLWELSAGSGVKTVYYQVIDAAGLTSPVYTVTATLDLDDPTGTIALANGAMLVNSRTVSLTLTSADDTSDVVGIRVQEEAIGGDEPWEDKVDTMDLTLTGEEGQVTVYYQVVDEAGHESQVYSVTFTLDTTNPFVSETDPADTTEKMPVDKVISVRFSEAMDTGSVEGAFLVSYTEDGAAVEVEGTFDWSSDGKTLTFTPSDDLEKGTRYSIALTDVAKDVAGNALFPSLSSTFTTEGGGDGGDGGEVDMGTVLLIVIIAIACVGVVFAFSMKYYVKMEQKRDEE